MSDETRTARLWSRIEEATREIGVLLIAFAPLDAVVEFGRGEQRAGRFALAFFLAGAFLFVLAIMLEWRRGDVE
jgi:hypothetical protein